MAAFTGRPAHFLEMEMSKEGLKYAVCAFVSSTYIIGKDKSQTQRESDVLLRLHGFFKGLLHKLHWIFHEATSERVFGVVCTVLYVHMWPLHILYSDLDCYSHHRKNILHLCTFTYLYCTCMYLIYSLCFSVFKKAFDWINSCVIGAHLELQPKSARQGLWLSWLHSV